MFKKNNTVPSNKMPIQPRGSGKLPIVPMQRWQVMDSKYLKKFVFRSLVARNSFLTQLFTYEEAVVHFARIVVKEHTVVICFDNIDLQPSEQDKKYAKEADEIYKDQVYSGYDVEPETSVEEDLD